MTTRLNSGEVVFLHELDRFAIGGSIRIVARVVSFDPRTARALVEMDGVEVPVLTDIMVCDDALEGLFTFIGEIVASENTKCLRARIGFSLKGLNLELYTKAVLLRRKHLAITESLIES